MDAPNESRAPHHSGELTSAGADRRDALRKLAIGGAIVWTAPMISRTAFAASASSCTNRQVDWSGFAANSTFSSTVVGGVTVTLQPSTFFGGTTALGTNRTIRTGPQGGFAGQFLRFEQTPITNGGQNISLSFSQPVFSVRFIITDIDNLSGGWSDHIVITNPTNYTWSVPTGSTVIGSGTATGTTTTTGPFRNSAGNLNYLNDSPGGNIELTFPGPLTSIGLQFRCGPTAGGGNQLINLTNIGFCA